MADITLKLKAPTQEKTVSVKDNGTIKELREEAAKAFEVTPARVCLIYAGKILKDESTLSDHKLQDGLTVHVVIKQDQQRPTGQQAAGSSSTTTSQTTAQERPREIPDPRLFSTGDGSIPSLTSMQQQVMRNPELLRSMMDSPLVQSLMQNPEVMRSLINANPQMRELMDNSPELRQMLSNPEVIRQSMEIATNPSLMQEMMRSYDRALLNLEALPGGTGHLQRLYQDVQEPVYNAMRGGDENNPFADLASDSARQTAPTNEPMPNPWAPPSSTTTGTGGAAQTTGSTTSSAPASAGSFLGGIPFNPEAMSTAFQAPYVRQMLEAMASNPETFEAFLTSNPLLDSISRDPAAREHLRRMIPQMARQVSQPGFVNLLSNPRAMRAMAQIQEGLRVLQQEAPDVLGTMTNLSRGAFGSLFAEGGEGESTTSAPAAAAEGTNTTTEGGSETTTRTQPAPPNSLGNVELATLLASMLNVAPPQSAQESQQPPEERYAAQLETLASMGFTNQAANLQALISSHGDVNGAIDRLLGQGN